MQYLLQQYADNKCTRTELLELMVALKQDGNHKELHDSMLTMWEHIKPEEQLQGIDKEQIFSNVMESGVVRELPARRYPMWRWAAACILFIAALGFYFLRPISQPNNSLTQKRPSATIVPGSNKAELTLANGKKLTLNNSSSGKISTNGNVTFIEMDKGRLTYNGELGNQKNDHVAFNTLTTPAGGQYQLILPDGTKVWLNASSSLRFPVTFEGNSRRVELTGEGYFEVAKNKAKPFIINANEQEIKVLGTHFNVMAYQDEASTNTTLLEGSVQVTKGEERKILVPGDQARVNSKIQIVRVDPEESIEWKNGNFNFSHEKIEGIMRKLSRWYNVDIEYHGKITNEGFVGTVPRSKDLSEVLSTLESTGLVHFKVKERSVIVMP